MGVSVSGKGLGLGFGLGRAWLVGLSPYEKEGGLARVAIGFVGENVLVQGAPALAACSLACIAL